MSKSTEPNPRLSVAPGRRKLQCQFCNKICQKREHLIRHERTHTGQKPFACRKCQRSFARQDSLLRHQRLHGHSDDSTNGDHQSRILRMVEESEPAEESEQHLPDQQGPAIPERSLFCSVEDQRYPSSFHRPAITMAEYSSVPIFEETEDFYQYLLSTPPGWPLSLPMDLSPAQLPDDHVLRAHEPGNDCHVDAIDDSSPPAVQQVNAMITDMSSSLTGEIKARGITSSFLEACLHQFFVRFNPTFPIIHESTFVLKDCGPFLLLTMVAIGSLFFGSSDAISKGEFLWRLAQTAAATSWGGVFEGRIDSCGSHAAQIVTTALLGQTYAMLSKSRRLRTLCQSLHGLAFSWARQLGMYDLPDFARGDIPDVEANLEEKTVKWKAWVSIEIQRRTVLGLYVIDSQLARYAGAAPVGKHMTNPLTLASRDSIFQAKTADEWADEMRAYWVAPNICFREIFLSVFSPEFPLSPVDSHLSVSVILEGFQAIHSEHEDANGSALGIPPKSQIIDAALRLHETFFSRPAPSIEDAEHLLRWHTLCLDLATDTVLLCQRLCISVGVEQKIFSAGRRSPDPADLDAWACSADARRALLHAFAIQDIAESLSLGRAYPAHLPASIFAAATIYYAFLRHAYPTVTSPENVDWKAAWDRCGHEQGHSTIEETDSRASDSCRFVAGDLLEAGKVKSRNLGYSLLTLRMILVTISSQWGISHDMLDILSTWISSTN